jgi:hypothetical protein
VGRVIGQHDDTADVAQFNVQTTQSLLDTP